MQIREATHNDIPQILMVLKASLGEISSRKTEKVWRYKHIDNPFGESLVLVAEEDSKIVGVRAFMRWKWQRGGQVYSAFRAVDTATHPEHQGKGIFKKLTLRALEIGKERGDHFVFNTPNAQSKPGYLKMGWKEVSKLNVHVRPVNLLKFSSNKFLLNKIGNPEECGPLLKKYEEHQRFQNKLHTPKDSEFLQWRYLNNPIQEYFVIAQKEFFLAAYVKDRGRFKEFRISEAIFNEIISRKDIKYKILELAGASGAKLLSISPESGIKFKSGITRNIGPVLTFKPMNFQETEFYDLDCWNYSFGDLELF